MRLQTVWNGEPYRIQPNKILQPRRNDFMWSIHHDQEKIPEDPEQHFVNIDVWLPPAQQSSRMWLPSAM
ncbi:hypothetical protein AC249_AIPGENE2359 [Exaiptasia diaphana]|nr:hypothetical protein AC249_AIPGENE2359 [Exaiptasia diaphana]